MPAGAVRVTLPPAQKVVGPLAAMVAAGGGLTVTVTGADVDEQPPDWLTVTVSVLVALTVIDCVVAPFDHEYDEPALAVRMTLPPAQKVVGPPGVIVAGGAG